jgi:hypothetical protein
MALLVVLMAVTEQLTLVAVAAVQKTPPQLLVQVVLV